MSKASPVFTVTPLLQDSSSSTFCQINDGIINAMHLNHPQTTPHSLSVEKLSSMKLVPGAKKVADQCYNGFFL